MSRLFLCVFSISAIVHAAIAMYNIVVGNDDWVLLTGGATVIAVALLIIEVFEGKSERE